MKKIWKRLKPQNSEGLESGRTYSLAQLQKIFRYIRGMSTTGVLRSKFEMEGATLLTEALGLPSHYDPQKNWDTLKCLFHITAHCDQDDPILDGGSSYSTILNWLERLGYKQLYACDLVDRKEKFNTSCVQFSVQDLTQTTYPDQFFAAAISISVIEHGIPLDAFLKEMARVLKPRGRLLVSTDYWSEAIDCSGIFPYGESAPEMKIFQPQELETFCADARRHGLELMTQLDLATEDKVVHWQRVDRTYTFAFMPFRKT